MKQALDLGHLRVAIPLRVNVFTDVQSFQPKGTCLMYRTGLKTMNSTQYPTKFDKDMTRDMYETFLSPRCLLVNCQSISKWVKKREKYS